ncbi:MAG: glycoside hydrolase family 3 C-terminal domain-containing protein [Verrucomicrobiota bacterium]
MRSLLSTALKLSITAATLASLGPTPALAAEESCATCDKKVSFSGDFVHRRAPARSAIEGAPAGTEESYREGIFGSNFTATISGLPDGKYTIIVGMIEASSDNTNIGSRVFEISVRDQVLAMDLDIVAAAGGANKVHFVNGTVDHRDDSIAGPIVVSFHATTGTAKMNTMEVKDPATGTSLVSLRAADLVDQADLPARQIPQVPGPVLWLDPSQPRAVRVKDLISRMSLAEKVRQMGNSAPAIHRAGLDLPAYDYWSEALHGVANTGGVTVFPQAIANGATWDSDLVKQMGHVIGIEGRAKNNDNRARNNGNSPRFGGLNFWSPNINLFRDPRWGRGQETYGEDTFLTSRMGVAFIQGLQGDDPKYTLALACSKHYAVHSGPEALRHVIDIHPSERDLYETYLPHFEAAVREGHVGAIMSAYNAVDGEPAPSSTFLLTDILRKRWGFDGQVVSDCDAVADIWRNHHAVRTAAEAAARAVKGGTDLCCGSTYNSLLEGVRSNLITMDYIDTALERVLESRFKLGLFDPSNMVAYLRITMAENNTPEHRQLALQLAREALVLLKNEGVLPLDRSKIKKIAVFGENATDRRMLYGNYNGTPSSAVTILQGIRAVAGTNIEVTYAEGCPLVILSGGGGGGRGGGGFGRGFGGAPAAPARPPEELRAEALSNAVSADILIYVGGINSQLEGEEGNARGGGGVDGFSNGDRTRIELPEVQEDFTRALYATGKPVIMINCSGSAMAIPWEAEHLPAILQAWYPGEEGGTAVAETLFGENNPSGRLPITFYRATADLPAFTNYAMANRTYRYFTGKPLYAFGHGLSYTHFEYSSPSLSSKRVKSGDTLTLRFNVRNIGRRDGDEVAQVYFAHVNSAVPQPIEALCSFKRVHVPAGKTAKVSLEIPVARLRYWDTTKEDYAVEAGNYRLMIGPASDEIRRNVDFRVVR